MSTTTIVCGSAELHSLLTAVRTAAGADDTLPMIAGVLLHTARCERRGDVLVATATDRYRALQGAAQTSGQLPGRVWLTRQQVTQVLTITRPYTTRRRAPDAQVEITVTGETVTVRQLALDGLADIAVTITEQDLPRVAGSTAVYRAPYSGFHGDVRDPGAYRAPRELVALAGVLDAIVDEEITHTGIRSLGITSATLRDAISHIGRAA